MRNDESRASVGEPAGYQPDATRGYKNTSYRRPTEKVRVASAEIVIYICLYTFTAPSYTSNCTTRI